jgi:hypothetical protein
MNVVVVDCEMVGEAVMNGMNRGNVMMFLFWSGIYLIEVILVYVYMHLYVQFCLLCMICFCV